LLRGLFAIRFNDFDNFEEKEEGEREEERRSSLSFFLWVGKKVMICRKEREVAAGSKSSPGVGLCLPSTERGEEVSSSSKKKTKKRRFDRGERT